jgi:hypothetical protein
MGGIHFQAQAESPSGGRISIYLLTIHTEQVVDKKCGRQCFSKYPFNVDTQEYRFLGSYLLSDKR